ncbi:MAG: serine/threonine-protein kinase, partial [Nannocystaceae bacterium]
WPEVLRVFREAGRGLAAAHKAKIVHRDFRPSNILMGRQGRIVVIDFGLAPELEEQDGDVELAELRESLSVPPSEAPSAATSMTGTAAYVAPEQHLARRADAHTDQFSFCVALYEALYGERPFSGSRPRAIALQVAKGQVRPAPPTSTVPAWLRAVVLRGLDPRPEQRFESMEALLRELDRDPSARRRRWVLGSVAALGLVAVGGGAALLLDADASACEGTDEALAQVWTTERRDALRNGFVATERRWAEPSWRYAESKIDTWSDTWREYSRLACMATRVWGDAAEKTYQLRVACLDRNLAELDATLEVLATVDGTMVDRSYVLAQRLPDPRWCVDTETLTNVYLPQEDRREDVEALHRELAALEARLSLGDLSAVQRETGELVPRVTATEDPSVLGRGQLLRGRAELAAGEATAEATLHEAALSALRAGNTPLTIAAWQRRLEALLQRDRAHEAAALADTAGALLAHKRIDWPRPDLEITRGDAERARGRPAQALEHYYAAIENAASETEQPGGHPDPLRLLPAWLGLSDVLAEREDMQEAISPLSTALDVARDALGVQHPALVEIHQRLGRLERQRGGLDEARRHFEQALDILRLTDGPPPRQVAALHDALGSVYTAQGDPEAATVELGHAFDTLGGIEAAAHPPVFRAGVALARSYRQASRAADARTLLETLLAAPSVRSLPSLPRAEGELLLADLQWDDGDLTGARALAREALGRLGDEPAHRLRRREAERWLLEHSSSEGEPEIP